MKKTALLFAGLVLLVMQYSGKAQIITFVIPGATNTYITCVNDSNVIGGYYDDPTGTHGFIYNGVSVTYVNYPTAVQTYVYGINNKNIVVGAYNTTGNLTNNEGFKHDPVTGFYTDITTPWIPGLDNTIARDINDNNCVVGDYKQSTTHVCFSMCAGTNNSFHYNYKPTYINSINNSGRRSGFWIDGSQRHGLLYTNGSWAQVDYPGATRTMFTGLNDSNVAVGIFNLTRSFVYKNGVFKEIKKKNATDFQIHDVSAKGRLVGYYKDASNVYKGFWMNTWDMNYRPDPDGWGFENSDANCWPSSWYDQFKYDNDPYLGGDAPFPKVLYKDGLKKPLLSVFFPDWPLFVELMGEEQCYIVSGGFKVLRAKAFLHYRTRIEDWGGSCFGFVQSSFMAWDSLQHFKAKYPKVGPWTASNKLYDLPVTDENRKVINQNYLKQYQNEYNTFDRSVRNDTPLETLAKMKAMFLSKSKNVCGLSIINQNGKGGHIVNPYKVEVDTLDPNKEYIFIYDNNFPGDSTRKIEIRIAEDCWFYNLSTNAGVHPKQWGGINKHKGTYIDWPVQRYYATIPMDSMAKVLTPKLSFSLGDVELYNSTDCDILATNPAGQSTGFVGGVVINDIPGGMPLIPKSGTEQPPKGYTLPASDYTIVMDNFQIPLSSLIVFDDVHSYTYERTNAMLGQKDNFTLNADGFRINNTDNITKTISLNSVYEDAGNEMDVKIDSLGQSANGSILIKVVNGNKVRLVNNGLATGYNLNMRYSDLSGTAQFSHNAIPFSTQTAHTISPDWTNLQTANVCIYVDYGNDGSNEDTLCFTNNEPPLVLTFPTRINRDSSASADSINITNIGGGTLQWTATSNVPSWLSINGSNSGTNTGKLNISYTANNGGSRSGVITFTAPGASNNPYKVVVNQAGVIGAPASVTASDGSFSDGVHLSWPDAAGATHYSVYRADTAGQNGILINGWNTATTFIDSASNKGQVYYYSIRAAQDDAGLNETEPSAGDGGWRSCFTAGFNLSGNCAGQASVFKNTTNAHTTPNYFWDIDNDGTTDYFTRDIQHVFASPGTYAVKMTVTDNSQCSDSVLQNVVIKAFPVISMLSDSALCATQNITLNTGGGFDAYLWSTGETTSSITVDSSGYGLGMTAFMVQVTNGNACSAYATARITWDTCGTAGSYNLAGTVTYDNLSSTPLNNSTVTLKQGGSVVFQTTTDAQGNYSFGNLPVGTYELSGASDKAWGGVNSIDALKVSSHFVELIALQGVRLMAADVNGTNSINSGDALLIAKRFVGINNSFVVGDWAFAKNNVVIGNTTNQTANLKAVVFGDVDGSYSPPAKIEQSIALVTNGILVSKKIDEFDIPVCVNTELEVGAVSLVMNVPPRYAAISGVTTTHGETLLYNYRDGELRIAWYSLSPMKLSAGDPMFVITCQQKPNAEALSSSWTIDPESQVADAIGDVFTGVTITMPEVLGNPKQYFLSQNVPNPFSSNTEISWFMPEAGRVTLKVYDLPGNEILSLADAGFDAGTHTVAFDAFNLQPGIYSYRIEIRGETETFVQTKQFVLIK